MAEEASPKVWFITGCSSGFGRRLVSSALARGDRVIATARKVEDIKVAPSPNLRVLQLDVTAGFEILKAKLDEAAKIWGQIDVVVNNAGVGYPALLEEGGSSLLEKQFRTNVFGLLDVTNAALPHLRASKSGTVVIVGSRSAYRTEIPGLGPYSASKAAAHTIGETLSVELAPFSIKVLIVAPGAFRTEGIYGQTFFTSNPIPAYDDLREITIQRFSSVAGSQKGDPDKAMEVVVDVVRGEGKAKGRPWPLYLALGDDADANIRQRSMNLLKHMDQWGDVIKSVNFDE
ncbi:hypothetical protein PILCRDRAFT_8866 [Piloderma croceum F 1598]|uniref:Uncharacterized protein n=1 Tax=Piloderma croceum (strain F 1598) TaxID=765440 RepID=A0A0C3FPR3_PILCF|nr:hypothetical protein PILCRDRAFT_8866 [Piloderma croceum F 1598]